MQKFGNHKELYLQILRTYFEYHAKGKNICFDDLSIDWQTIEELKSTLKIKTDNEVITINDIFPLYAEARQFLSGDKDRMLMEYFDSSPLIWKDRYYIPDRLKIKAIIDALKRSKQCVYCGATMNIPPLKEQGSINNAEHEHIDNDGPSLDDNVCLCCAQCNSSKGSLNLLDWFKSDYCLKTKINRSTVASVIKDFLEKHPHGHV